MGRRLISVLIWMLLITSFMPNRIVNARDNKKKDSDDTSIRAHAQKLHHQSIVIDSHNDIPMAIADRGFDLGSRGDDPNGKVRTHTDLRRMKAGGVTAEIFSIWVDPVYINKKPSEGGGCTRRALDLIDAVTEQLKKYPSELELAASANDIRRIKKKGRIAILMGIEGGHAIEDSLHTLKLFYSLGARYMTLTHSNTNDWADSSSDILDSTIKHHDGLTDFGRQVIREMNRLGMMVDVSHISDKTFYDVINESKAPIIASHSCARAIANHPRNLTDDMLRAIAKNRGVVMVNFYDVFLDPQKVEYSIRAAAYHKELMSKYPDRPDRIQEEMRRFRAESKLPPTPLSVLIDHIDHMVKVAGINHVGLGSDFDGISSIPEGIEDISKLPNITYELVKRGYSDEDIKKILGENFLRVMTEVEDMAKTQSYHSKPGRK